MIWTPAGAEVAVSGASAVFTSKIEGAAKVTNVSASAALVALVSVNGTVGEALFSSIPPNSFFFIAYGSPIVKAMASQGDVRVQPVNYLK